MKKVIVFRSDLLPPSETFIKEQVLALTEWSPTLTGYRTVNMGLRLDGMNVCILPGLMYGTLQRRWLRLCQWFGWAHRPTEKALRELNADLVHAHFGTDATDIWPSVRATGLPMLVTLHGYDINTYREWWEAGHGGRHRRFYPHRLLRMAKDPRVHFIAVSHAIKKRAIEYGIPEEKVTVAYIGVNTSRFKPDGLPLEQRRKRILFVGRMVANKAPLLMIRAFAEVRKEIADAELVMIGNGPLQDDARRLADALDTPVAFLGACSTDEVLKHLHEARTLCLTSVVSADGQSEGFGLVLLEAQSCGVPVVSASIGGANEALLDGITGYKFSPGNIGELVKCIGLLLDTPSKAEQMSIAASAFVQKTFDIEQTSKSLEKLYLTNSKHTAKYQL